MASCHSALLLLVAMSLSSVSAQPALTGFSLNMTPPEELILTFNSDVDPTACDASAMTMHGTAVPQPNSSVTFQGGNCTATSLSSVQVSLPSEDWMNVQGNINLAISSANTFISLTSGFIQSPGGVSNIATVALQASVFTKNFDLPTIMQAFLSLDGFMVFIFNEAVNPQTVTAAGITILYTDRTNGAPGSLTLSGMANVELAPGNIGAILQIMFTTEDLNNLKFYSTAPYSVNIATNTFRDGNTDGNIPVVGYPIFSAEDTTPPNLNSFDIDLNVGTLVLTFDEPINIDNVNISIVSLTNTTDFSGRDYTINNSMIVTATDLNTIITIQLENDVVNAILADFDVCNSVSDCFLFAPPLSFADFGGQTLIDGSVIVPGQFVADRVSPQLTSYSINLNNGSMTLQFTEPLDELQFSPAGIKLTDSNGANSQMLDNSAVTLVQDRSTIFTVTFKSTVLDNLKIFQRGGGILLTMDNTTALDTSGNAIVPILNGIPPSEIDADTTGPILVGFVLSSPEQGQLTLSFNEAIDTFSIDLTTITLTFVSPFLVGTSFVLTGGASLTSGNSDIIVIALAAADLTNFFDQYNASYFDGSFMLTATNNLAEDLFGNTLQELIMPLRYSNIPQPVLGFELDLDIGSIVLTFADTVDTDSLVYSNIYIAKALMTGPTGYNMSGSSFVSSELNMTIINFQMPFELLNILKFDRTICNDITDCFLLLSPGSVLDDMGDPVSVRPVRLQVTAIQPDQTSPNIIEYTIDLDAGTMSFSFDEPINPDTFAPMYMTLYNDSFVRSTSLDGAIISSISAMNSAIAVELGGSLNLIKVVAQGRSALNLVVNESALADISGNLINPVPLSSAIQPSQLNADLTPPQMTRFMARPPSSRSILMFFDEYVIPSSFDGSRLKLSMNTLDFVIPYNISYFTTGTVSGEVSDMITFMFSGAEFTSEFESQYTAAFFNGYIGLTSDLALITDLDANPLAEIEEPLLSNNDSMIPDIVRPALDSFSFDLNTGQLVMTFSENVTLLVVTGRVTFQDAPTNPTNSYALTGEGMNMVSNGVVTLTLGTVDINAIKNNPNIASQRANTYVSLDENFVQDFAGLPLDTSGSAVEASEFTEDVTTPQIISTSLDLNSGIISIIFTEPVSTNIILSEISVTSVMQSTAGMVTMEGSSVLVSDGTNAIITINTDILNQIKSTPSLCTSPSNCFLYLTATSFSDINDNPLTAPTTSFQVTTYVPDTTLPALVSFDLDLTTGRVTFYFDEPILQSSLDLSQISIATAAGDSTNLASGINIETETFATVIIITLPISSSALNQIKVYNSEVAVNIFLFLTSQAVTDTNGNPITAIPASNALLVSTLTADIREPELLSFSPRPLEENRIFFRFDEFVNTMQWNGTVLTLVLNTPEGAFTYSNFNEGTQTPDVSDLIQYNFGGSMLMDTFRTNYERAYERGSMTLGGNAGVVQDLSGNLARGVSPSLMFMNNMTIESIRPEIVSFNFSSISGELVMSFTESVIVQTVVGAVSIQNLPNNPQIVYELAQPGAVNTADNVVILTIDSVDLDVIRSNPNLGTSTQNTYLRLLPTFLNDLNENPLLGRSAGLQASSVEGPTGPTVLASFDLDMNDGTLTMTFSNDIQVSTVQASMLTIQSTAQLDAVAYSPSGLSMSANTQDSNILVISVANNDLNALKGQLNLATLATNTWLSFPSTFAQDIFGVAIASVLANDSIQVSTYTPDTTPPIPTRFRLDMNSGIIDLTFNEPMNPDSVNFISFAVQNSGTTSTVYTLTGGELMSTGSDAPTQIDIVMTTDDLNGIKIVENLATNRLDSFVNLGAGSISDISGNGVLGQAVPANSYQRDIVEPALQYFDLNLNDSVNVFLTLQFNEPVVMNAATILPGITLQNTTTLVTTTTTALVLSTVDTLTQSNIPNSLIIMLRSLYATIVRSGQDIGGSGDTFYMSLTQGAISDYASNQIPAISSSNAMRVRNIYRTCMDGSYADVSAGVCIDCFTACVSGCSGSLPISGQGGCDRCHVMLVYPNGTQDQCVDQTSGCPEGYYDNTVASPLSSQANTVCQPCQNDCFLCSSPTVCTACTTAFVTSTVSSNNIQCLGSCDISSSSSPCGNCHSQCDGCTGVGNTNCVQCKGESMVKEGVSTCVPRCSDNEYLVEDSSGEYSCQRCHVDCNGCTGPTQTDCIECRSVYDIQQGVKVCRSRCGGNSFSTPEGECMPCDSRCLGCTGLTNMDCISCASDSSSVTMGTVVKCERNCPSGQVYDETTQACITDGNTVIIAAVVGAVAGILILVVVVVVIVSCVICLTRFRGKFIPGAREEGNVLFIDAKLTESNIPILEDISAM